MAFTGLWLFCCVWLMVGTHDIREVFNTEPDIDVRQVMHKRLVLDGEQDVQQAISALQAEVVSLKSQVASLQSSAGSVYTRWGRTSCPDGAEMMYRGLMAGNEWDYYGGGSNHLCLPDDPTWAHYVDGVNTDGKLYGTEIEVPDDLAKTLFGKVVTDQDVPCAVCRTVRPSNAMIPGRANCYPGWTVEYSGYVVTSGESWHNSNDYVCLDSGLEFAPHGAANDEEHVINVVEIMCGSAGSLPCPPFVNGREAACVVCSK